MGPDLCTPIGVQMLILSMSLETGPRACRQGSHRGLGDPERGKHRSGLSVYQRGPSWPPPGGRGGAAWYTDQASICVRHGLPAYNVHKEGVPPLFGRVAEGRPHIVHGEAVAYTD